MIALVMPDDPGNDIPRLGYRGNGCYAPIMPLPGIHFQEGETPPMYHQAVQKWHIGKRVGYWLGERLQFPAAGSVAGDGVGFGGETREGKMFKSLTSTTK